MWTEMPFSLSTLPISLTPPGAENKRQVNGQLFLFFPSLWCHWPQEAKLCRMCPPSHCLCDVKLPQCPRFAMGRFNDHNVAVGLKGLLAKPKKNPVLQKAVASGLWASPPKQQQCTPSSTTPGCATSHQEQFGPQHATTSKWGTSNGFPCFGFSMTFKSNHFFLILPGSAKLALDLSFQLRLPVNKQHICCQSGADTERLMLLKLSRTSWDSALSQFYPNNDFQIKPTIRPLIRARESS